MKFVSLLIPHCLPPAFQGATPFPFQSGTVDRFERELAALSPLVLRHTASRLRPDLAGRFVHTEHVTRYELLIDPETDVLGQAVALALKSFAPIDSITVILDGDAEPFNAASAEDWVSGMHPWQEYVIDPQE